MLSSLKIKGGRERFSPLICAALEAKSAIDSKPTSVQVLSRFCIITRASVQWRNLDLLSLPMLAVNRFWRSLSFEIKNHCISKSKNIKSLFGQFKPAICFNFRGEICAKVFLARLWFSIEFSLLISIIRSRWNNITFSPAVPSRKELDTGGHHVLTG